MVGVYWFSGSIGIQQTKVITSVELKHHRKQLKMSSVSETYTSCDRHIIRCHGIRHPQTRAGPAARDAPAVPAAPAAPAAAAAAQTEHRYAFPDHGKQKAPESSGAFLYVAKPLRSGGKQQALHQRQVIRIKLLIAVQISGSPVCKLCIPTLPPIYPGA